MSIRKFNLVAFLVATFVSQPTLGETIFVDGDATGPIHDGSSWCSAYLFLQDALGVAVPGNIIRMANGVYRPDDGVGQTMGNRQASFALVTSVELFGGYAGCGAADPDERDVDTFETIFSGDLAGNDGPNFVNNGENAYHVLTGDGTTVDTVLDGVTVIGGNANADSLPHDAGGGMRIAGGSPLIRDCRFTGNSATFGGGIENFNGGNPTVTDCMFVANQATFRGGGMHNNTSNPVIIESTFLENVAINSGGGMRSWNFSAPVLSECQFIDNHAGFGGGMVNDETSATLRECSFIGNTANDTSGGMHNWISNTLLVNCLFLDNEAFTRGGAMFNLNTSIPTLINCTVGGNFAGDEGGGLYATASAGALVDNTIMWGNTEGALAGPGVFTVAFSNIEGGAAGPGNINVDPLFVNEAGGDLRLGIGSPCIDAGDSDALPTGIATDLDGNDRIVDDLCTMDTGNLGSSDAVVDMGAYEFQGYECCGHNDCDDGFFCNGFESCVEGACEPGTPVDGDDGVACTIDFCDEELDHVVNMPDDSLCDNGLFCDGMETCSPISDCQPGDDPCGEQFCDEDLDACVDCFNDTDCSDGDPCNGEEVCGADGACQPGVLTDCNENGVADSCDIADGTSVDNDGDGVPDECQAQAIPTVSQWGLMILALLLLSATKAMSQRYAGEPV